MQKETQRKHSNAQPKIWDYLDPVEYLRSHYEFRKAGQTQFSYAIWAHELGIKSRSFLRLVLTGKRNLTTDFAHQIIANLNLNKTETQYFLHLVGLKSASTLQTKEYHSRELSRLHQKFALKRYQMLEIQKKDLFDFLSSYQIPRIQVLLTLENIEKTPKNLAQLLKMKESDLLSHLQTLKNLGLAKEENNTWSATQSKITTPDELGNIALQSFHRKSLEEATHAITLPKESRRFQSAVIALTEEQFKAVHNTLREKLESLLNMETSDEGNEPIKIYQINLNMIPVTEPIYQVQQKLEPEVSTEKIKNKETP